MKYIGIWDAHCGWEFKKEKNKIVKRTTHNPNILKAIFNFAEDFKPDVLILGGDQMDFSSISKWNKDKPRLKEGQRVKDELDLCKELLVKPAEKLPCARLIWHQGNHDERLEHLLDSYPELEGLLSVYDYLGLKDWEYYGQGEVSNVGKVHFCHGDSIFSGSGHNQPAAKLVDICRKNIRCGHLHTWNVSPDIGFIDSRDFHTGVVVPCTSNVNPAYIRNRPTRIVNGFLFGETFGDGTFEDSVKIIVKERFRHNGREYGRT